MTAREQKLIRQFQNGEAGSFEAFYAEYGRQLYRFCFRLCRSTADAEDLMQEVFLAAYQGIERFEGRALVTTWLYRIAIYCWRRLQKQNEKENISLDEDLAGSAIPAAAEKDSLTKIALDRALAALSEDLRLAFLLVKSEGFKYREAAEILGIPQGTIQYRVSEAVTQLREILREPAGQNQSPEQLQTRHPDEKERTEKCNVT